ncbi:murein L,D-transpeptidase catalytic domain family protein [Chondrinema litorale]|uniref:murein L,D-transpeptidase catalytic domain family protein n=1 Tax=Chondrinema litorale TaxID=2994555 RepID=UPI0025432986|nr:murein L,D-transpeptidase catalytic domain family protein [Chondrinema litorale]UZR92637.1 murein L,D-transpeptidase catalytic domain family protein [Chondrinema litorale]
MSQKIKLFIYFFIISFCSFQLVAAKGLPTKRAIISTTYELIKKQNFTVLPSPDVFEKAMTGFLKMKEDGLVSAKKEILSIIDFSISSTKERLWVIDLKTGKVLYHTLVAHGRNTGVEYATKFSNIPSSFQSSLGFYTTGNTYIGKHGLSLYLNGQEKGINDNAKERAIVIHGAEYVSEDFVKQYGRLGRSLGCPALPMNLHKDIIKTIASNTCLFIYYPSQNYITKSKFLMEINMSYN